MITLPLPVVDAARSGWFFYSGKDAKTVPASLRRAPVRSLSTALADGGFNYLLVFALSSLGRWRNTGGAFLR